jgi:hypothetical protein
MSTPFTPKRDDGVVGAVKSQPQSVAEDSSIAIASRSRSPLKFFLLVFALSIPFWLIGSVTALELLPGLPVSALMLVCPVTAASILVYSENQTAGVITLLKRSFDYQRVKAKVWYDPRITGLIVAFAAAIVTVVWVPRTLARHRKGCAPAAQR